MKKIVITGPESTGKSSLCSELSSHFDIESASEFARKYIDELDSKYAQKDLTEIAKGQIENENLIKGQKPQLLLCDTDLLTLKIWSEYKYGNCDGWIITKLKENLPDLYLLCSPDIAWKYDKQRENKGEREKLFTIYKNEIEKLEISYSIVEGEKNERIDIALSAINSYL